VPTQARCSTFATYFVGFAARPIGAAIFGHWGDRIGRKTTLIITLLVMGNRVCSHRRPARDRSYRRRCAAATRDVASAAGDCGRRRVERLGAADDEWGDQKRRGLLGSFAQIGVPVGLVLGHRRNDAAVRDDVG